MNATAKVFADGHSQAIHLPKAFRVDVDEMWISRNDVTGVITLKPKDPQKTLSSISRPPPYQARLK